ncbi:carbamate kinase [candidate division KSB3 bacterium]|uniref:Carbamate kinase n=1 Tax=candidate division KSB3 bacterium TaxID=2044937 RepID=A0A2G6E4N7_9BACT|nr:MAG: carbamate kinase [candidate division KSB3 bacterium]PIE29478.1 MAG: carbamate kinase [candidate division KSB3 bacterium]
MGQKQRSAVVALGGNCIIREGQVGNIAQQFTNTQSTVSGLMKLIEEDYQLLLTHGNGPQVGNLFLMVESTRNFIPELPLGVCVADTQSQIGYMIQQSLQNHLLQQGRPRQVVTLISQVVVDHNDPSLTIPKKPIGPIYSEEKAREIEELYPWKIFGDSERGYRLVVPSPVPVRVVETPLISSLLDRGIVVIAGGGGGIPVIETEDGGHEGVDVVIEKDLTASLLARDIKAELLVFLTKVEKVAIHFNTPQEQTFEKLHIEEAMDYLEQGQFPSTSMGPKIRAAIDFLRDGGEEVLITAAGKLPDALAGLTGTRIVK